MGCCVVGCLRLFLWTLWRALLAALIALLFARVDWYIEKRGWGESIAGRAWRTYRARGKKDRPSSS